MRITPELIPDVVEFSIPKFSEYNPRRDVQRSTWFRLEHNWFLEISKKGVSGSVAGLYPVLIGVVAGSKGNLAKLDIKWLARTLKMKSPKIKAAFAEFANHGMVVIKEPIDTRTCSTNERTNETNETNVTGGVRTKPKPKPKPESKQSTALASPKEPPPGSLVWDAYAHAYEGRYRTKPKRNAKANALCAQLVKRLGLEDAIRVVEFYLTHNKAYYLQKVHALDPCVADCEGLHTQAMHDYRVTTGNARQEETRQTNVQTFMAVAKRVAERKANERQ